MRRRTGVTGTFQYSVLSLSASPVANRRDAPGRRYVRPLQVKARQPISRKEGLMSTDLLRNVTIGVYTALAGLVLPTAAHAQFTATPFSDPATGERYHIEASGAFWNPPPDIVIASES